MILIKIKPNYQHLWLLLPIWFFSCIAIWNTPYFLYLIIPLTIIMGFNITKIQTNNIRAIKYTEKTWQIQLKQKWLNVNLNNDVYLWALFLQFSDDFKYHYCLIFPGQITKEQLRQIRQVTGARHIKK